MTVISIHIYIYMYRHFLYTIVCYILPCRVSSAAFGRAAGCCQLQLPGCSWYYACLSWSCELPAAKQWVYGFLVTTASQVAFSEVDFFRYNTHLCGTRVRKATGKARLGYIGKLGFCNSKHQMLVEFSGKSCNLRSQNSTRRAISYCCRFSRLRFLQLPRP